jgi:hypothetical protein
VALLAVDRIAFSPLMERRSQTQTTHEALVSELSQAHALMARRQQLAPKWQQMVQAGMVSDPAEAESRILHAIGDWAQEAGISLSLLKPDRLTEKSRLPEIAFQASGVGNLRAIARLLWRVQTAAIPIKVTEMQVGARKEGEDNLTFQIRVSTVYSPPPSSAAAGSDVPGRS